jgi:hypothetical protein
VPGLGEGLHPGDQFDGERDDGAPDVVWVKLCSDRFGGAWPFEPEDDYLREFVIGVDQSGRELELVATSGGHR